MENLLHTFRKSSFTEEALAACRARRHVVAETKATITINVLAEATPQLRAMLDSKQTTEAEAIHRYSPFG